MNFFRALNWRGWGADVARALLLVACASGLGLGVNALSAKPMNILDVSGPGSQPPKELRIGIRELKSEIEKQTFILLIDVRPEKTYIEGHPAGAIHAPAADFMKYYSEYLLGPRIRASTVTVLLCESDKCHLADQVAKTLRLLGHTNVRVLYNGWQAYKTSGLETEKGAS